MEVTHSSSLSSKDELHENSSANGANGDRNEPLACHDSLRHRKDSMCAKIRSDRVGMDAKAEVCREDDFQQHAGDSEKCGVHIEKCGVHIESDAELANSGSKRVRKDRMGHCYDPYCLTKLRWRRVDKFSHAKAHHGKDTSAFIACEQPCTKCALYKSGSKGSKSESGIVYIT